MKIDPTDIFAIVLMAIFAVRRVELRATDGAAFPWVPSDVFEAWKARAKRAKSLSINACFAKFAFNSIWFFGFRRHVTARYLETVGAMLFFAWIAALIVGWWLSANAARDARRLGIVVGRRIVPPEPPPGLAATEPVPQSPTDAA